MNYTPWHEAYETEKLAALVASMQENGWVGGPLVADGSQLLTGSHRFAAANEVGIEAPVIDIREIVENWDDLIAETGMTNYEMAIESVVIHDLTESVKAEYGIDIH